MTYDDREFMFDPPSDGEDSPVTGVLELTRRKWTRSIIEHLIASESLRFNELREEIDGISDKVLSESLKELEEYDLVCRNVVDDRPVKVEYSLTEAGAALEQVMDAVADWVPVYRNQIEDDR